ncbi:MAG TPA: glycosyltransferase [Geminicoccaceae bacterium]|nr:glycosyltransferase [Geminicoccus sp.]HMU51635.1 glycosyltransferase [Geminicoccaceae bacterium]
MHVAVCCITFRRPDGLRSLLEGLARLGFARVPAPRITVIVVDNDAAEPMREVVENVRGGFPWGLVYASEAVQGVASARNRCLDLVPADADYIASIDDDEVPVPGWLDELLAVAREHGAPIVQGPVRPAFVASPPGWVERGRFLELGPYEDGRALHFGYAGNCLIEAAVVRRLGLRFDERFNRTGGEDQHFFGTALKAGLPIVTAAGAIVDETVPPGRATLRYLLRRRFRMGNTLAMIERIDGGRSALAARALKGCGRIAVGIGQCVLLAPRGLAGLATGLCNMAWGTGALVGLLGLRYREY